MILVIILIIFILLNYSLMKKESFSSILFLTKRNTEYILTRDRDNYFNRFFKKDLDVRHVKSIDEYKEKIKKSVCSFRQDERKKIEECVNYIIMKLQKISYSEIYHIDIKKFLNLPWKFGLLCNNEYENGLPHTREDVILLTRNHVENYSLKKLRVTILHEQVHVYQKKYTNLMINYLNDNQFKRIKCRSEEDLIRANPDIDDYIYQDKNNNTYRAVYNDNAKSVEDITYYPIDNQKYEHPFEQMAIYFEKLI